MNPRRVALLACVLAFVHEANANVVAARRALVQELAKDITRSKKRSTFPILQTNRADSPS
jgi:hypothetical protein